MHAFHDAVSRIDDARERVAAMRNGLTQCKSLLQVKSEHVRSLWKDTLEQTETLRILDKMCAQTRACIVPLAFLGWGVIFSP